MHGSTACSCVSNASGDSEVVGSSASVYKETGNMLLYFKSVVTANNCSGRD